MDTISHFALSKDARAAAQGRDDTSASHRAGAISALPGARQLGGETWGPFDPAAIDDFDVPIATVPMDALRPRSDRSMPLPPAGLLNDDFSPPDRPFCIRAADSFGRRSSANVLVSKMYAWRGYHTGSVPVSDSAPAHRITLVATDHQATVGTITIGFDNPGGLMVDELFPDEISEMRGKGIVCEFTKLAVDGVIRSKRLIASLFHVAYLFAHRLHGAHRLMIEVNPRHVRYYERVLGFQVVGPERLNRRVNAPAVLLCLELAHARAEIRRVAGLAERAVGEKSLYPYFFSTEEEAGILARLQRQ